MLISTYFRASNKPWILDMMTHYTTSSLIFQRALQLSFLIQTPQEQLEQKQIMPYDTDTHRKDTYAIHETYNLDMTSIVQKG